MKPFGREKRDRFDRLPARARGPYEPPTVAAAAAAAAVDYNTQTHTETDRIISCVLRNARVYSTGAALSPSLFSRSREPIQVRKVSTALTAWAVSELTEGG